MKKILLMALCSAFTFISCSVENETTDISEENLTYDLTEDITSVYGTYKGVFTSNNAKYRGTIEITVPNPKKKLLYRYKTNAIAEITLHTGEKFYVKSIPTQQDLETINDMTFESDEIYFLLSVGERGTNPQISDVVFKNLESDIIIAKHTSRAPVNPRSGTWDCTVCNDHPVVGQGGEQTFNMMFVTADGNSTITTQSTINSTTTDGIGVQSNCAVLASETVCDIESGDGMTTTTGFLSNGNPVTWVGDHKFDNGPSGANDCSTISGTWSWESISYGVLEGFFVSDPGQDCDNPVVLATQDFDGTTPEWVDTPDIPYYDEGDDYFGPTNGTANGSNNITNPSFSGNFLYIRDLANNGSGTATGVPATITFSDIAVNNSGQTFITLDYDVVGYDNGDDIEYIVVADGVDQAAVLLVEGVNGGGTTLQGTLTITVPPGNNTVGLKLRITQNGNTDYAGFDNFTISQ